MTPEFKDMIDRLAIARNNKGGNFILATAVPNDTAIEINCKAIRAFKISVIRALIDDVLNGAESEITFNFVKNIILDRVTDAEEKRFQQREIKEDADADA